MKYITTRQPATIGMFCAVPFFTHFYSKFATSRDFEKNSIFFRKAHLFFQERPKIRTFREMSLFQSRQSLRSWHFWLFQLFWHFCFFGSLVFFGFFGFFIFGFSDFLAFLGLLAFLSFLAFLAFLAI